MEHTGCVFAAGIHLSRTYMFRSFESVPWNACVHRLDLSLYSHLKEFWENGARNHVNSKGKVPSNIGSEEVQTRNTVKHKPNTLPAKLFQPLAFDWPCGLQPRSKVKNYAPPPPPPPPPLHPLQNKIAVFQNMEGIKGFSYQVSSIFCHTFSSHMQAVKLGRGGGVGRGRGGGGGGMYQSSVFKVSKLFLQQVFVTDENDQTNMHHYTGLCISQMDHKDNVTKSYCIMWKL